MGLDGVRICTCFSNSHILFYSLITSLLFWPIKACILVCIDSVVSTKFRSSCNFMFFSVSFVYEILILSLHSASCFYSLLFSVSNSLFLVEMFYMLLLRALFYYLQCLSRQLSYSTLFYFSKRWGFCNTFSLFLRNRLTLPKLGAN
jgi:hypothetical protein